jgi:hypothetical protein
LQTPTPMQQKSMERLVANSNQNEGGQSRFPDAGCFHVYAPVYLRSARPGACRTWGSDSERSAPPRSVFDHFAREERTIAQELGEKWAGAVGLQPEIPKSDRLPGNDIASSTVQRLHSAAIRLTRNDALTHPC